jgi:hypothetical protein
MYILLPCCRRAQTQRRGSRAFGKQGSQGQALRTKGALLMYHLQWDTEMGVQLVHTWSHTIPLAILTSGPKWPSLVLPQVTFLKYGFLLFRWCAHCLSLSPFPSQPSCHIPPFDAQTHLWVKEHHLDLEVYISTASLHGQELSPQHMYLSCDISFLPGQACTGVSNTLRLIEGVFSYYGTHIKVYRY